MIPEKTIEELINKHSILEKDLSSGEIDKKLGILKQSKETTKSKVKFILATDGEDFISEDLNSGEILSCSFKDIVNHFGFFLPLAGIETTKNLRENSIDIRATS